MLDRLSGTLPVLEKGLDAVWKKNEVLAANIANADTPGYKAKSVDFESVFSQLLGSDWKQSYTGSERSVSGRTLPDPSALENLEIPITENRERSARLDGNTVDPDREMTSLAENAMLYDTLTYAVSRELGRLKMIINEGK